MKTQRTCNPRSDCVSEAVKAWRIVWTRAINEGALDEAGIYIAETRGKAMAKAVRQVAAAGYEGNRWTELRCSRAPEYDGCAARQSDYRRAHGIVEEWVRKELKRGLSG